MVSVGAGAEGAGVGVVVARMVAAGGETTIGSAGLAAGLALQSAGLVVGSAC